MNENRQPERDALRASDQKHDLHRQEQDIASLNLLEASMRAGSGDRTDPRLDAATDLVVDHKQGLIASLERMADLVGRLNRSDDPDVVPRLVDEHKGMQKKTTAVDLTILAALDSRNPELRDSIMDLLKKACA